MNTTQSLTQQFAAEEAKGVVPAMVKAIKAAKRDTRLIVAAVLAITYQHQAHWLSTIDGIGILGWFIPIVVDLAMLRMLGIVQTTGMKRPAKTAALVMTAVLASMSATINVIVPGSVVARVIFGVLVLIAAGVKVVTALVGPDFKAMEAKESEVAAHTTAVTTEVDEERKAMLSERAKRAAATRKQREDEKAEKAEAARAARRAAAAARRLAEAMPISANGPAAQPLSAADQAVLVAMDFPTR